MKSRSKGAAPTAGSGSGRAGPARGTRLDQRLVELELSASRSQAEALIRAGRVLVDDAPVDKPGTRVRPEAAVRVRGGERRYVSRGGDKLAGALAALGIDPAGRRCLDVGASTGGFTDCLLQHGAVRVVAVDVGYGQFADSLRRDPRVRLLERTNARHLTPGGLGEGFDFGVADVSFISLRLLLPGLFALSPRADWLLLVKPQFEVGRERVGKGGVVRDDALRAEALEGVAEAARGLGYRVRGSADSALPGPRGNREIFLWVSPEIAESEVDLPASS